MFSKLFKIAVASAAVVGVLATPLPDSDSSLVARHSKSHSTSFNNYDGISSMSGFDNFYGSKNFIGSFSHTTVVENQQEVVCHSESIEIIQQRLLVIQEMAKRIITEQICEVETQTIVFEQFYSSMGSFSGDLLHHSGRSVGYDSGITSHYGDIQSSDGSLSNSNLGFSGSSIGSQYVVPGGSNWNSKTSPKSVQAAYNAAQSAISSSG